jgi:hypothetical protein
VFTNVLDERIKGGGHMTAALQVNFALWIMIGCATAKAVHLVEYLN